jgi:hypothetical protein
LGRIENQKADMTIRRQFKMGRYRRFEVINAIYDLGLIPVFFNENLETAKNIVKACANAGARVTGVEAASLGG